jgi:hypothetical protein
LQTEVKGRKQGEEGKRKGTYEANVFEQPREDPYPGLCDHNGDAVEDKTKDSHSEEGAEQAKDADGEVPNAETEGVGPEGEHDGG